MSASHPRLDPTLSIDDPFLDAVVGLDGVLRLVEDVLGEDLSVERDAASTAAVPDELVDALLGVASLRTTLALVIAAASSELAEVAHGGDAGWSRELLR